MLIFGQKVSFARSNGKPQIGKITFIDGDILTVEWSEGNKKAQKTLFQSDVNPILSNDHRIDGTAYKFKILCFFFIVSVLLCLILDYYFYLKKVIVFILFTSMSDFKKYLSRN